MNISSGSRRSTNAIFHLPEQMPVHRALMARILIALNTAALVALALSDMESHSASLLMWRILGYDLAPSALRYGAFAGWLMEIGEYWRLIASVFLHQGVVHLVMNMIALYFFAFWIETLLGPWKFLLLYLASGIFGNLFGYGVAMLGQMAGMPSAGATYSIGASGAVFGVLGALLACNWVAIGSFRAFLAHPRGRSMLSAIFFMTLIGLVVPIIDGMAHLGGMLAGFCLGFYFFSRLRVGATRRLRLIGDNSLYALIALTFLGLFASTRPANTNEAFNEHVIYLLRDQMLRPDLALRWVDKKAATSTSGLFWELSRADLLISLRRYDDAISATSDTLQRLSGAVPQAHYLQGRALWRLGKTDAAVDALATAIGQALDTPTSVDTLTTTPAALAGEATLLPRMGLAGHAPPWVSLARISLIQALDEAGRVEESRRLADQLARMQLAQADAATSQADALIQNAPIPGFFNPNPLQLREARQYEIITAVLLNQTAWAYAIIGYRLDEALQMIDRAIEIMPVASFIDTRGWILFKQGKPNLALADLERAQREFDGVNGEILYHLAVVLDALNHRARALQTLRQALDTGQDFDDIHQAKLLLQRLEQGGAETEPDSPDATHDSTAPAAAPHPVSPSPAIVHKELIT